MTDSEKKDVWMAVGTVAAFALMILWVVATGDKSGPYDAETCYERAPAVARQLGQSVAQVRSYCD